MADKVQYLPISSDFSNAKLKKAYAKLRKAFDEAKAHRESVVEPARKEFDALMKDALVDKGMATDAEYIEISHRFGLQYAVHDEPIKARGAGKPKVSPVRV